MLSSTQCAQLKLGFSIDIRHEKGKKIIQWNLYFSNFGFKWSERTTNRDLKYIGGTCINLLNFVVSCRVLRIARQRDPWQHAASLPQQEQAEPEKDLCFFLCFVSSWFLFYFVRRQLKRKVKEKISYMSPGHSSWPGYNRELLLGRRRPPTKKDILSFTLNHGLSFFSFPSDLYTWSEAELQQAWLGQHWLATVQQVAWDGGIRFDVTPSSQSSSWLSSSPSSPPSSWYIITVQQVASDLMDVS